MPLNAVGWTTEADEKLIELVQPHTHLYDVQDPSRKNILTRETTWHQIANDLQKPVEECKKRWRGLRDGYMRSKRMGSLHKTKLGIFEKLHFLDNVSMENGDEEVETKQENNMEVISDSEQQVITDNQEYYEITVVETPLQSIPQASKQSPQPNFVRILPKGPVQDKVKKPVGRRKLVQIPQYPPIKILPKPIVTNELKTLHYVEDQKAPETRSQTIDKLIEKVLKENTNEIDVFFRSMAASVKKLQPNLIPKVKMEVCNVVAKYEMQNFERNGSK